MRHWIRIPHRVLSALLVNPFERPPKQLCQFFDGDRKFERHRDTIGSMCDRIWIKRGNSSGHKAIQKFQGTNSPSILGRLIYLWSFYSEDFSCRLPTLHDDHQPDPLTDCLSSDCGLRRTPGSNRRIRLTVQQGVRVI